MATWWQNTGVGSCFHYFFVSGLWHGAALTFVVWGLLHGAAISWDVISQKARIRIQKWMPNKIYTFISIFITFHFLVFSAVLLKVPNLTKATEFYNFILTTDFSDVFAMAEYFTQSLCLNARRVNSAIFTRKIIYRLFNGFLKTHWTLKAVSFAILIILLYQLYSLDAMPLYTFSFK